MTPPRDALPPDDAFGGRSVAGRVAVVTGGASGIGQATARLLALDGAAVAVADRDAEGVKGTVDQISAAGGQARAFPIDVADVGAVRAMAANVDDAFGPAGIVVNAAGICLPLPFDHSDYDQSWNATLAVDLTGYATVVRAFLDQLRRAGRGRIVNVASTEGLGATASNSAYVAAKHGVIGLTHALAVELGREGICANCICPGPINTAMTALIDPAAKETFAHRRVPLRRYGEPTEVAHAIVSLAAPAMTYVNGAVLRVDGGMLSRNA